MITIIILIILAGVGISVAIGQNGIFTKSKEGVSKYQEAAKKEEEQLDIALLDMTYEKYETTTKYKDKNGDTATIPGGYYLTENNAVDEGLVIKDSKGNEWVWVPVQLDENGKASDMYTESETDVGLNGMTEVKTKKYSKLYDFTTEGRIAKEGTTPSRTSFREPGYLSDYDNTTEYFKQAGFTTSDEMTKAFVGDYEDMITSIETYGGFYIGRYELGKTSSGSYVEQKYMKPVNNTNWYVLYKACRDLKVDGSDAITTMIWGTQYDATMDWLQSSGYNVADSRSWGNYITTSLTYKESENGEEIKTHEFDHYTVEWDDPDKEDYEMYYFYDKNNDLLYTYDSDSNTFKKDGVTYKWDDRGTGIYEYYDNNGNKIGSYIIPTGGSENTKSNNIYDLAGNLFEWTQEAFSTNNRVRRGGSYVNYDSDVTYASYRGNNNPNGRVTTLGSRATLYIVELNSDEIVED